MVISRFYCEMFGLLPFELLSLFAPQKDILFALSALRLNRLARVVNIPLFNPIRLRNGLYPFLVEHPLFF